MSVTDTSGTYNGAAFTATDTVAGVGSQSTPAASLEGVTPSLTYYSGTSATGTALSGAPTTVGTYTVLASFAGSTDYTSGAASTTFTIGQCRGRQRVSVTRQQRDVQRRGLYGHGHGRREPVAPRPAWKG